MRPAAYLLNRVSVLASWLGPVCRACRSAYTVGDPDGINPYNFPPPYLIHSLILHISYEDEQDLLSLYWTRDLTELFKTLLFRYDVAEYQGWQFEDIHCVEE